MFNQEFYPTPYKLAQQFAKKALMMLDKPNSNLQILDPSAGKGDLLKATQDLFKERGFRIDFKTHHELDHHIDLDLFAIEISPDLRSVLEGKSYTVIDSDFLEFETHRAFDLILMNPPFSCGVEHLLKAWEISKGGTIACILNAETIKNPYSQQRQLLAAIIEQHGDDVEFVQLAFAHAERKTKVEIALVILTKPAQETYDFNFSAERVDGSFDVNDDDLFNQVARTSLIDNWIIAVESATRSYKNLLETTSQWRFYVDQFDAGNDNDFPIIKNVMTHVKASEKAYNHALDEIHGMAWKKLFEVSNVDNFLTSKVKRNFSVQAHKFGNLSFTHRNVEMVIDSLKRSKMEIMKACVVETFDFLTLYHEENRMISEGWKTNDSYRVNKRVIIDYVLNYDRRFDDVSRTWTKSEQLSDIEKAICFIEAVPYQQQSDLYSLFSTKAREKAFGSWHDSRFFRFRFYKKGTMHLEFKNKKVWENFNETAAKGKNWLPKEAKHSRHQFNDDHDVA